MKKIITLCLIFTTYATLLFSEPLKQFQTFSWKKVAKAKKYEIAIEKQTEDGSYTPEISEQLTDNRIELLLYPGNYRVAISVFNVLGRKTSTTSWTNFIILDETQPYLYTDSFTNSKRWKSPILNLKQGGVQIVEEEDDEGSVIAREGDPTNSFFLHGKNIFFEETTFSMVPKADSETGVPFEAYVDLRKEIPLNIVRRDTENGGVVVEYNQEDLFSGYYDIVVKNPGEQQTSLELLVLSFEPPKIDNSIYQFDEHYKVSVLDITQGLPYTLEIKGTGFDNNTIFTFSPDSSLPPYPFASSFESENPSFYMNSHKCLDEKGTIDLQFNLSTWNLHTGYYRFLANNGTSGSDSIIFLIKVAPPPTYAPSIEKVKTKTSVTSESILFNVTGKNIDEESKITLISPYSEETDTNERIPITYLETKKKGELHIMQTNKDSVEPGQYALLVENSESSSLFYFDVNEKFAFTFCDLSEYETSTLFLRPKDKQQYDISKNKVIESKYEIVKASSKYILGPDTFLSAAHISISPVIIPNIPLSVSNMDFDLKIDLVNLLWMRLDFSLDYSKYDFYDTSLNIGGDLFFEIPGVYFQPFVGVGFYGNSKNECLATGHLGVRLFTMIEASYQLSLINAFSQQQFFVDKFSIGAQIPLHSYKYIKKPGSTYIAATIAENDIIDGTEYEIKKNTHNLKLDSRTVAGFANNKSIKTIVLSDNVCVIENKAFENMPNLESISLKDSLVSIGEKAFANDTKIESIIIPLSVTNIAPNAFEGWTEDQIIYLCWTSDDETPRELAGLENTNAYIEYQDGIPYRE